MHAKRGIKLLTLILLLALLAACGFEYGDGLLSPPKLPSQYVTLQNRLDAILGAGAFYAVADQGPNRQSVQLIDIDGNGVEEAVAFFREPGGQYRIYVYRRDGKDYVELGSVEGYGNAINAVYYPSMGPDGRLALAVSWKFDETSIMGMTVYGINDDGLTTILDLSYSAFDVGDTNEDGVDELLFTVRDDVTGSYYTRLYAYRDNGYGMISEAPLCSEVRSILSMQLGKAGEEGMAMFVDSVAIGGGYVTDVLSISKDGMMLNETIYPQTGSGISTWRSIQVLCSDINGDGIIEVPSSVKGQQENTDLGYNLLWSEADSISESGGIKTYHNVNDEWFLEWPSKWGERVIAERGSASAISMISFKVKTERETHILEGGEELLRPANELLRIYTFTGDSRLDYYMNQGVKIQHKQGNNYYGYMITQNDFPDYSLSEEEIVGMFKIIERKWSSD